MKQIGDGIKLIRSIALVCKNFFFSLFTLLLNTPVIIIVIIIIIIIIIITCSIIIVIIIIISWCLSLSSLYCYICLMSYQCRSF